MASNWPVPLMFASHKTALSSVLWLLGAHFFFGQSGRSMKLLVNLYIIPGSRMLELHSPHILMACCLINKHEEYCTLTFHFLSGFNNSREVK
jgi:hypothetical protein